jgi:MFS family permease
LLWLGQIVSSLGTRVSQIAFPLLVLTITRSPAEAGLVGAMRTLPYPVLVLPAGAYVDRWDRKRVMILCDAGRSLALGTIPLALVTGHLTILQLAIVALFEGTLFTFFNVAETACLPRVVGKEQVGQAVSFNMATDAVSQMLGPSIGGALYGLGRAMPFLADAISYATSVLTLSRIRTQFQGQRASTDTDLWQEVKEGMVWLWRQPLIRVLALMIGTLNLFSMGWVLLIIVLAQRFHASSFSIGLILAAGGIGGVIGASLSSWLQRRFGLRTTMLSAVWLWSSTWPIYLIQSVPVMAVAEAVGFTGASIFMVTALSYRLSVTPDHLQGRVNAIYKLLAFGPEPLSLLLTGALIQMFGPVTALLVCMTPQVMLAVWASTGQTLRRAAFSADVV